MAEKLGLSLKETESILFCHIEEFMLDQLINYASKIFKFLELEIVKAEERAIIH